MSYPGEREYSFSLTDSSALLDGLPNVCVALLVWPTPTPLT
jgi:hypothetical protein